MNIHISLDALQVLDAIDRQGSFAAAAAELHRVPSAITYVMRKLEADLDLTLYHRNGRRAQLTAAGRELLEQGRHLLRSAHELEARVKRAAQGWEAELRLAVSDLIPLNRIYALIADFDREQTGTRLRVLTEVFGGTWDALFADRADLAIGSPGDAPAGGGYNTVPLGMVNFAFVVSPDHPLANKEEPLAVNDVARYRAVSAADSSRTLPARTAGLVAGQPILTVPDIHAKRTAQLHGLGIGYLPDYLVRDDIDNGRLIQKRVQGGKQGTQLSMAWRSTHKGKALEWFVNHIQHDQILRKILSG